MDDIANYFLAKNALYCRILHTRSQNLSGADNPRTPAKAPFVLGPRHHQFLLCSPAFPLLLFYQTTAGQNATGQLGTGCSDAADPHHII